MKNKFFILIIVVIIATIGISAFLLAQNPKTTVEVNKNNNNTTINSTTSQNKSVVAVLEGPKSAEEGDNIQIVWKITNNLNVPITNVQGIDQNEDHNFGQINPGETKTYSFLLYIPSLKDITDDFGLDATLSNPFYIGGFNVKYFVNGVEHNINSNSLEIVLVWITKWFLFLNLGKTKNKYSFFYFLNITFHLLSQILKSNIIIY